MLFIQKHGLDKQLEEVDEENLEDKINYIGAGKVRQNLSTVD